MRREKDGTTMKRTPRAIEFDFDHLITGKHSKTLDTTVCELRLFDSASTTIYVGVAKCNPVDVFTKAKGRVMSLSKALGRLPNGEYNELFTRESRKRIFEAYYKTGAGKPKVAMPVKVVFDIGDYHYSN